MIMADDLMTESEAMVCAKSMFEKQQRDNKLFLNDQLKI